MPDGTRPAVLYTSAQHAREWISPEVNRRLLAYFISQWRANDKSIKKLLQQNEYWFVLVANPDGYQYTFSVPTRGCGGRTFVTTTATGRPRSETASIPNRNLQHWNYDNEGSSGVASSDTYRGGRGVRTRDADVTGLYDRIDFAFHVNYHSAGQWLLYPEGADRDTDGGRPGRRLYQGTSTTPRSDFHPGISSDVLCVTNGETTDFAHVRRGTLAWTPELSEGCPNCGFVFPDDEALVPG